MKAGRESKRIARQLYRSCFENGHFQTSRVSRVLQAFGKLQSRDSLAVLVEFHRFVKAEIAKRTAVVESAVKLSEAICAKIHSDLKLRYGQEIDIQFTLNPDLLAGVRIRIGNDVWDGSVRGRLARLNEEFQKA